MRILGSPAYAGECADFSGQLLGSSLGCGRSGEEAMKNDANLPNSDTELPGGVLVSSMWWWAANVFYPAQVLKSLGLYHGQELGSEPTQTRQTGAGRFFSLFYPEPVKLSERPPNYDLVTEFDRLSNEYDSYVQPFSAPIYTEVELLMRRFLPSNARILDASAGPGKEMIKLSRLVPRGEVVGIDLSAEMVATAWRNARQAGLLNTAHFQADVACMSEYFEHRFDAIYCSLAFHHYPDPSGAAREMRRVLADGGKAFIADPGPLWFNLISAPLAKWADPGWIGYHTPKEFRQLFLEAGFADFYWREVLPGMGVCIASA